mmetsp:Transcript_24319/g.76610  ORF Transcript_24319/g.76610 Transcript_24319/m.76610 type:complete len:85 (+) Transcript_24319:1717-1971(+)
MLPTLALIKKEKVTDYVVGFQELGDTDAFETEVLRNRLAHAGVINYEDDLMGIAPVAPPKETSVRQSTINRALDSDDETSDFDD